MAFPIAPVDCPSAPESRRFEFGVRAEFVSAVFATTTPVVARIGSGALSARPKDLEREPIKKRAGIEAMRNGCVHSVVALIDPEDAFATAQEISARRNE